MKALIYVLTVAFFLMVSPVLSQPESTKVTNGWRPWDSTGIRSFLVNDGSRTYQVLDNLSPPEKGYFNWWNQYNWFKDYWTNYPIIPDSFAVTCRFISSRNVKGVWIGLGLEDSLWIFSGYRELIIMDSTVWQTVKFDMNRDIKTFMKNFGILIIAIHITTFDSTEAQIAVAFDCISGIDDTLGIIVYDTFGDPTGISQNPKEIPTNFSLSQNYPNPFNPSTKIKFTVPSLEYVSLVVYNSLGQEMQTLVREEKPEGIYEVSFNASNLPSGTYFYRLQAGSFVETKKMILMK